MTTKHSRPSACRCYRKQKWNHPIAKNFKHSNHTKPCISVCVCVQTHQFYYNELVLGDIEKVKNDYHAQKNHDYYDYHHTLYIDK